MTTDPAVSGLLRTLWDAVRARAAALREDPAWGPVAVPHARFEFPVFAYGEGGLGEYDLICSGSHPFSQWYDQHLTDKPRYHKLIERTRSGSVPSKKVQLMLQRKPASFASGAAARSFAATCSSVTPGSRLRATRTTSSSPPRAEPARTRVR